MENNLRGTPQQTAKKSVVDQVADSIVQDLIDGKLSPGDRIPTEPELCSKLGVGRNSVREAVKKLEACGVVHIRRADGTFISEQYNEKMLDPVLYSIILQKNSWADFVQLRKVVDVGTLHVLCAREMPPKTLSLLWDALAELERALHRTPQDLDLLMDCDTRFHDVITAAAENPQLATIAQYITRLTIPSRRKTLAHILAQGNADHFLALHRQLVEILAQRRTDLIDSAVSDHYLYWA